MTGLVLALPSKGRLQEQAIEWLSDAGLALAQSRGARDYAATLSGVDGVTVSLLSAGEIADEVIAGRVHMGITGEDLLAERGADASRRAVVLERLGFGRANVIVAVPRSWIDVSTMADLDDVAAGFHARHHRKLRVATKFVNLAREFFSAHGIADYRIVESLGATEGAPAAGTADVIVDITTTGATLAANDLKILDDGVILESQAALVAGTQSLWSDTARAAARVLLDRISARTLARQSQVVRTSWSVAVQASIPELERRFGARPLSAQATSSGEVALIVPDRHLGAAVARLQEAGAGGTVTAHKVGFIFAQDSGLAKRLEAALQDH